MNRLGEPALVELDRLFEAFDIAVVSLDMEQAILARSAALRYGKGRDRAQLNFGDCLSYALAKQTGELLLFKGNDFIWTDLLLA